MAHLYDLMCCISVRQILMGSDATWPEWQALPFLSFPLPHPDSCPPSPHLSPPFPFLSPTLPSLCSWMWSPPCGRVTSVSWSWGSWTERLEGGCSEGSCGEVEYQVGVGAARGGGGDDGSLWHLLIWPKQLSSPLQSWILRRSGSELCIQLFEMPRVHVHACTW